MGEGKYPIPAKSLHDVEGQQECFEATYLLAMILVPGELAGMVVDEGRHNPDKQRRCRSSVLNIHSTRPEPLSILEIIGSSHCAITDLC